MDNSLNFRTYTVDLPTISPQWKRISAKLKKNMEDTKPQYATMSEVVMKKEELLNHLVENKAKHDVILATAIDGYWDMAKTKLEAKKAALDTQLSEQKAIIDNEFAKISAKIESKQELPNQIFIRAVNMDASLGLVYPQDHSQDYDRAIRMMQSSVFEQVQLSVAEYDAYVLNNWEWKTNFILNTTAYVDNMRKKQGVKGRTTDNGIAGTFSAYATASAAAVGNITVSGCCAF